VTALVRSELLKLRTTRLVPGLLLGFVGLIVLYVGAVVSQTSEADLELTPDAPFGGAAGAVILVLLLGITVTAGEYRHGTITATFLVCPVRERVLAAKLVAALLLGLAFAVAGVAANVLIGWPAVLAKGADVSPLDSEAVEVLGATLLACALWAALGAALGSVTRNQVSAIVGAVVWFLIAEPLVGAVVGELVYEDVGRYLPASAIGQIFGEEGGFSRAGGALVTLGWIAGVGALGTLLTLREDVT
jgi:ABC-2 type transport system permease protein